MNKDNMVKVFREVAEHFETESVITKEEFDNIFNFNIIPLNNIITDMRGKK